MAGITLQPEGVSAGDGVCRWTTPCQHAVSAARPHSADLLGMAHDQGMQLIEEPGIGPACRLNGSAELFVGLVASTQLITGEQPAGIGIDYENRPRESIQQDVIGGLGTDTRNRQQRLAQLRRWQPRESRITACLPVPAAECLEALRLDIVVTGRFQAPRQVLPPQTGNPAGVQPVVRNEVRNRLLDIGPGGILRQYCTDHDFKGGFARPPVLGAPGA
jgi:hypothetical protein